MNATLREHVIVSLYDRLLELGDILRGSVAQATDQLQDRFAQPPAPLFSLTRVVTTKRFAIELAGLTLIADHRPDGTDLRLVIAALEGAAELEGIARHVSDIVHLRYLLTPPDPNVAGPLSLLAEMSRCTQDMLGEALERLRQPDAPWDGRLQAQAQEIAALGTRVLHQVQDRPRPAVKRLRYLLQIARHLEHIARHTLNACEWVSWATEHQVNDVQEETTLYLETAP